MAADPISDGVRAAAEAAARDAYGRLVAVLTARTCDIAAAEDAVSSAFVAALDVWPRRGIPDRPEAWLLTVARRKLIDAGRKQATAREAAPDMIRIVDEAASRAERDSAFPDERLKLMFICAHPALDPALHTPLMLQTVLGFDAARIGAAFLVSPAAMSQRLVRAKTRLRTLQPGFIEPDREEWPDRIRAVLHAIYAAYAAGAASGAGPVEDAGGLIREAAALARILTGLLPGDAEALGLLALILYGEARRPAARDASGGFIPLGQQDTARWDMALISRAEALLRRAIAMDAGGRFVLEAAIQSAHCARAVTRHTDWDAILALYDRLISAHPTAGAIVARACALGSAGGAEEGLATLEALDPARMVSFQPYWAARGYLLAVTGDMAAARESYERAADLATDPAVRDFLKDRAAGS
ncbi:RNA polymerase sigma factor [Hyphobacterium marinum]|uniref:DUF6596 domain-containing protein n=1 Tax=Hyphobacterium marinum TaxID=3116574 RepID=A0ABU7LVH1_9PROT|nr:DUF6596 domain-containing protein [Hyphobacterium sp. Y6023]MEE2565486.1 DUF6596 domain-containing protein [Hyphobacterium sp. Y6023]